MKVFISGYGKMGHIVEKLLREKGLECSGVSEDVTSADVRTAAESVCIDLTTPQAIRQNYVFLAEHFKAVVIGTTGWDDIRDEVTGCFEKNKTTLVYSSNFSIGVNVFFRLAEEAARLLGGAGGYMPYIEEKHHCHKLDRPSGTAKMLEEIIASGMKVKPDMASVRCGEIPGIHTVGFEGMNDRIALTHEAFSREGFAEGAIEAAVKADSLAVGVYKFKDIIFRTN